MKAYFKLSLFFVITIVAFGQEETNVNDTSCENPPVWKQELDAARNSDSTDTFAAAFNDPNVLIGVFERPKYVPNVLTSTMLSSGKILEELPGYWEAMTQFEFIIKLRHVESIKGEFTEPVVFVVSPPLILTLKENNIPIFAPVNQTKWILALKKTTSEYRVARLGKEAEKYAFLNDNTVFSLFHWGYGALCLQWPEKEMKPENMVQVSEDIIPDLQATGKAMPHVQKKQRESSDTAAIEKTKNALKTNKAKAIFDELLQKQHEFAQPKGPN